MKTHQILIIGGGSAGLTIAAQLLKQRKSLDIAVVEPSEYHYYQPAWTLVGGGTFRQQATRRRTESVMPKGVTWIRDRVSQLKPEGSTVQLEKGGELGYQYLVVCPGIQINWDAVKGLKASLGRNGVCSNYGYEQCTYTWKALREFKGGKALFTNPNTPIKCGGAPQKIMYLAADYFRKQGLLSKADIHFTSAGGVIFGVQPYRASLEKVIRRYGIHTDWHHNLKAVDADKKEATFDILEDGKAVREVVMPFDLIHVTPPQSAPDFIRNSSLAGANSWMEVDQHTLQSPKYPNVFGLGDAAGTPNAKTGAAVRKQAPVVVANLLSVMDGKAQSGSYNGYGSCPLITGYGKLILAEFDYTNTSTPTFPFDQSKERFSMWCLKKYFLPWFYWNRMLKGLG